MDKSNVLTTEVVMVENTKVVIVEPRGFVGRLVVGRVAVTKMVEGDVLSHPMVDALSDVSAIVTVAETKVVAE